MPVPRPQRATVTPWRSRSAAARTIGFADPQQEYVRVVSEVGVPARQERRHLGHEFLADVLRGAEPVLVEAAVEPTLVPRGVRQFVQRSLVEPYGWWNCLRCGSSTSSLTVQ